MWKESYSIGVDLIDNQHKQLFEMTGQLLDTIQNRKKDVKQACISAITYLKDYTLNHFRDEEEYQRSINYSGYDEHVQIHQRLIQDIQKHETKMENSEFDMEDIKDFAGMLITWLVCHVAGDDQLIASKNKQENYSNYHTAIDSFFYISICDILSKVSGLSMKDIKVIKMTDGEFQKTISIKFKITGDVEATATYKYTEQLAFNLMKKMSGFSPKTIDVIVSSSMTEITNLAIIKTVGLMTKHGFSCQFNKSGVEIQPAFLPSKSSMIFDTGIGILEMDVVDK